jgi:hypothetical protein
MCFGGKSSSNTQPPAPNPPTTFDYSSANRGQSAADGSISQAQAAKQVSTTASFGSELGGASAGVK